MVDYFVDKMNHNTDVEFSIIYVIVSRNNSVFINLYTIQLVNELKFVCDFHFNETIGIG